MESDIEMVPQVLVTPRDPAHRKDATVDEQSVTYPAHPSTEEETPHGCIAGVVYIGHVVISEEGEEVEVFEAVPCKRCKQAR